MANYTKNKPLHRCIPSAWKRWYMLFSGIANGEVTSLEEDINLFDSEDNQIVVKYNITNSIVDDLYDETFCEPQSSIPTDLNDEIPTESILFELKSAAEKILVSYNKASVSGKQTLNSLNVNDQITWIIKCSQFIIDLVDNYRKLYIRVEDEDDLQFTLWEKYDCDPNFSLKPIDTLYHAIIECCKLHNIKTFEDIDSQKFITAVCCFNKSQKIKPTEDCGMIIYAIICILSTICQDQYSSTDTGRRYWADIFLNDVIDWTNLRSVPTPGYWLRCYMKDPSKYFTHIKSTIPEEGKKTLSEFLNRPAFDDLFKLDNIAKYSIKPYSFDEYKTLKYISCITENRSEKLKLLYKRLSQETTYLLNVELGNLFMDKEEAELNYVMSKVNHESILILDSCIDEFYLHQSTNCYLDGRMCDLGDILKERHLKFRVQWLYQYPLACSDFITDLVINLIDINQKIKKILMDEIIGEDIIHSISMVDTCPIQNKNIIPEKKYTNINNEELDKIRIQYNEDKIGRKKCFEQLIEKKCIVPNIGWEKFFERNEIHFENYFFSNCTNNPIYTKEIVYIIENDLIEEINEYIDSSSILKNGFIKKNGKKIDWRVLKTGHQTDKTYTDFVNKIVKPIYMEYRKIKNATN